MQGHGNSRVDESLNDRHSSLGELLLGVSTSSVRHVDGMLHVDVVDEGDVLDLNPEIRKKENRRELVSSVTRTECMSRIFRLNIRVSFRLQVHHRRRAILLLAPPVQV